tara:strand:- start:193 stop:519 length:327 start_codon:yes stop_codon:yes gene_type:complete
MTSLSSFLLQLSLCFWCATYSTAKPTYSTDNVSAKSNTLAQLLHQRANRKLQMESSVVSREGNSTSIPAVVIMLPDHDLASGQLRWKKVRVLRHARSAPVPPTTTLKR